MLIDEGLELLTEQQCAHLLREGEVGRVGITIHGLPVIMPVNYAYVDGEVVFRTSEGTKLHAATQKAVIAFEVDAYDADTRSGWSVLVIGRSSTITEQAQLVRLAGYKLAPWSNGARANYVRVRPELVTGRRIAMG